MLNGYGKILPGFSYTFRGEEWYAADQNNAYWQWEQGRIAQRQQAEQQKLDAERAGQLMASVSNKQDVVGFTTGGMIDSVNEASRRCTQLESKGEMIRYRCPSGEVTVFLAEYLNPNLVAIVRLNFCDPKEGPAVAADVAQQFGILQFPWVTRTSGQSAVGPLGSGKHLELFPNLPSIPVPGYSTGCADNFTPYSLQVVDDGVIQRNTQAKMDKERLLMSTPTQKF